MKRVLFSAALLFVAIAGVVPAQEILKIREDQVENVKQISALQGRWKLVGMQKNGARIDADSLRGQRVLFHEDRMVLTKRSGDAEVFRFNVDATKAPKRFNLTRTDFLGNVTTLPGIIQETDSGVRIVINVATGERPTTFLNEGNRDVLVLELQRGVFENEGN